MDWQRSSSQSAQTAGCRQDGACNTGAALCCARKSVSDLEQDASPLLCALPSPPPPIIIPRRSFSPPPPARGALRLGLAKLKRAADDAERRMIIAADRAHTAVSTAASSAAGAVMTALKG